MASTSQSKEFTISDAAAGYLHTVAQARSENTARAYSNGMKNFAMMLEEKKINPGETPVSELPEEAIAWLISSLKYYAPATEQLYIRAVSGFYEYLSSERLLDVNLTRIKLLVRQRSRKPGIRLPQFPKDAIDEVIEYIEQVTAQDVKDERDRLRSLRDRAFLLTLADTGLRVHEACNLRRGDLDWNEGRAVVIGKGNREAVVRFSRRSQMALKSYLSARARLDGGSGRPLASLPLFARHDKGAGSKVKPVTTTTGRNIVAERVREALGEEAVGKITPHSFRHYFVTRVLQSSGNLKLAQELARHVNIAVTQRYAHLSDDELDRGYWDAIEQE
jgi:site-specific recombinase XerD